MGKINRIKKFFDRIADYCIEIFIQHFWTILFLFLMSSFTEILFQIFYLNVYKSKNILVYILISFFYAFCFTAIIIQIRNKRLLNSIKFLSLVIVFALAAIESFTLYYYKTLIGPGILNVVLETNLQETKEFLEMYIGLPIFSIIIGAILLFWILHKYVKIKCNWLLNKKWYLCSLLLLGMILSIRFFCIHRPIEVFLLPRVYFSGQKAVQTIQEYKDLYSKVKGKATLYENKSRIKNIVFIVGESTNRNHMGIYGYGLNTTPDLEKLQEKGNVCVFRDVISPHSHTSPVIAKLFTFSNYEIKEPWYKQQNLVSIFNEAGYKTFWLSNQESSGIWGNVAHVFADLSMEKMFVRYRDSKDDYIAYDEEVLPLLDISMKEDEDKRFFVIHLMGTHGNYKNRYPNEYGVFKKDDIISKFSDKEKSLIATYDNAVLYNDFVVSQIIKKFENEEAIIIYISDHGEEVYDYRDFVGHTEDNGSKYMIEVPMIVWTSTKFKELYPDKVAAIQNAVNRPYMSDDMIHTFLDLAEIKTSEYDPTRSLFNNQFNAQRKRIYHNQDYDKEMK